MPVYAILIQSEEGVELLPKYFSTYDNALTEAKRKYSEEWDDRFEADGTVNIYSNNKVEVGEGHKANGTFGGDPNLTELYIERGIYISIRRLVKIVKKRTRTRATVGGYSRKRNTKNSRKHRV